MRTTPGQNKGVVTGLSTALQIGQTQLRRMESKLARQMAYKKRLEQEYRDFQERCKVRQLCLITV